MTDNDSPKINIASNSVAFVEASPIVINPYRTVIDPIWTWAEKEIDSKYSQLGGLSGFLGKLQVGQFTNIELLGKDFSRFGGLHEGANGGFYKLYRNGAIFWTPDTEAHEIHGDIKRKWVSFGRERGFLGYPLTDELAASDGVGRFNHFQGGSIYWTPSTGSHEIHGAIRQKWADLGWEKSFLGYPISDELEKTSQHSNSSGRVSYFQRGHIVWDPQTGATVIPDQVVFKSVPMGPSSVSAWAQLAITSDGFCSFRGHVHESGALSHFFFVSASSTAGYIDGRKCLYVWKEGTVHGTLEFGSRDYDWQDDGYDKWISDNWEILSSHKVNFFIRVDPDPLDTALLVIEGIGVGIAAVFLGGSKCDWEIYQDDHGGAGGGVKCRRESE